MLLFKGGISFRSSLPEIAILLPLALLALLMLLLALAVLAVLVLSVSAVSAVLAELAVLELIFVYFCLCNEYYTATLLHTAPIFLSNYLTPASLVYFLISNSIASS